MRFVSGPCSDTQPAASSAARKVFEVPMLGRLEIPCAVWRRSHARKTPWGRRRRSSGVRSLPLTRRALPGRESCSLRSYIKHLDTYAARWRFVHAGGGILLGGAETPTITHKPNGPRALHGPVRHVS